MLEKFFGKKITEQNLAASCCDWAALTFTLRLLGSWCDIRKM